MSGRPGFSSASPGTHAWIRNNILGLAAICAALAIAPPLAAAKKLQYEGPIDLARNTGFVTYPDGTMDGPFSTYVPTIQLKKVEFDGKTPVRAQVKEFGVWGPCSGFGTTTSDKTDLNSGKIRNGRFSTGFGTFSDSDSFRVTGRITRGSATGTVRRMRVIPQTSPNQSPWGTCDSGVLSWTATRVNQVSDESDLR